MQDFFWISLAETHRFRPDDNLPSQLGPKGRGLLRLPRAWVPKFVTASPDLLTEFSQRTETARRECAREWSTRILEALDSYDGRTTTKLILRSNAVDETLAHRGRYDSRVASRNQVAHILFELLTHFADAHAGEQIGLVAQMHVEARFRGHLSNERRLAEEYRDAVAELERIETGEIREQRISHRHWRRALPPTTDALLCRSEDEIVTTLREPLNFAARRRERTHFEWVWDGRVLYVVQADLAADHAPGVDPRSFVRDREARPDARKLHLFRAAQPGHESAQLRKLSSHLRYMEAGFWQPDFFVLDNRNQITAILDGRPTDVLLQDLNELTKWPLVLRTDSHAQALPLLPRSNQLCSVDQALDWLRNEFAPKARTASADLCLIGHHYVPALASAFSLGWPDSEGVEVQALWGIPEGLYYHDHDRFIVHTRAANASDLTPGDYSRFAIDREIRHKSHIVAPDEGGTFRRFEVGQPWDWRPAIAEPEVLGRISEFTRELAAEAQGPVNVMWFLECETRSGLKAAIPWYQENATPQTVSTFQRHAHDEVVTVSTDSDLASLERRIEGNQHTNRLVVQLSPIEDAAIRDAAFARRVGEAAARLGALIVLNGSTLAHIFYVLRDTGANVCTRRSARNTVSAETHRKLVRDQVPQVVHASGEQVRMSTLAPAEFVAALKMKLVEEALEVRDASRSDVIGELADVQEVLNELAAALEITPEAVEAARRHKEQKRGAFKERVLLIETSDAETGSNPNDRLVRVVRAPPLEAARRGPVDARRTPNFFELVQKLEASITHPSWVAESPAPVQLPLNLSGTQLSWRVETQRVGPSLRIRLRVRVGRQQLEFPFYAEE